MEEVCYSPFVRLRRQTSHDGLVGLRVVKGSSPIGKIGVVAQEIVSSISSAKIPKCSRQLGGRD